MDASRHDSILPASDIPEAIQWHEGMLLAPQHFQQLAWRQETLLHYATLAASPFLGVCVMSASIPYCWCMASCASSN